MKNKMAKRVLIIGVGNAFRCDDGVGVYVARQLASRSAPGVMVREESGEGASLIEAWQGHSLVFVIDATSSDSRPGTVCRLDACDKTIPTEYFHYSTHAFSLAEAVEMARALRSLPEKLLIYGIEGGCFDAGQTISESVRSAADRVARLIEAEIVDFHSSGHSKASNTAKGGYTHA